MRVVTDPTDLQRPIEGVVANNWKVEDLAKDLVSMTGGRSFESGRAVFNQVGCMQCHKMREKGGVLGPDLTETFKRWKGDRTELLRQIIEPSKVVEEKYRAHITTSDGLQLFGLISSKGKDHLMVVTNPQKPVPQRIDTKDIVEQRATKMSLMPQGLLNRFKKQQILDLIAYLESAGDPNHRLFRK